MSMTESEAIAIIEDVTWNGCGRHYGKIPVAREMAIFALEEVQQLHAIGTVSEFRELKEKATAKKPIPYENTGIIECPHCYTDISDSKTKWCCICGQHLDWSEGKE